MRNHRLTDSIARHMIELIQEMAPGSTLPSENQLAKRFGVSRSVAREAVSGLALRGMLETRQGAGMFAVDASISNFAFSEIDYRNLADTAKFLQIRSERDAASSSPGPLNRIPVK